MKITIPTSCCSDPTVFDAAYCARQAERYEDAPLRYPLTISWRPPPDPRAIPGPHPRGHVRFTHHNAMVSYLRMAARGRTVVWDLDPSGRKPVVR